jgi:multimeric flavodoxin WrbA
MQALFFNGSPRNNGSTAALLNKAREGASSKGAKTEYIQLNQLTMRGCQACFSCKKRGSKNIGKCALVDDMNSLYPKIEQADAIFLGSPIYIGTVTAATKIFIERLFPYLSYKDRISLFPKKISVGLFFTMGVEQPIMEKEYLANLQFYQKIIGELLGRAEIIISTDTPHVQDYSTIEADFFEAQSARKLEHQRTVFKQDCQKAFDMGARFVSSGKTQ